MPGGAPQGLDSLDARWGAPGGRAPLLPGGAAPEKPHLASKESFEHHDVRFYPLANHHTHYDLINTNAWPFRGLVSAGAFSHAHRMQVLGMSFFLYYFLIDSVMLMYVLFALCMLTCVCCIVARC